MVGYPLVDWVCDEAAPPPPSSSTAPALVSVLELSNNTFPMDWFPLFIHKTLVWFYTPNDFIG